MVTPLGLISCLHVERSYAEETVIENCHLRTGAGVGYGGPFGRYGNAFGSFVVMRRWFVRAAPINQRLLPHDVASLAGRTAISRKTRRA
jgi:hypothetical protein